MSHAHHFLSRLDRLKRPDVELALALYRDDERLRFILDHAHIPGGAERVAVSLDDPHGGPFVLVTRSGRFVTCLGRGMHAGNLPIVTRAELDAITARHTLLREREAARTRLVGPSGEAGFLFNRLLDSGPYLAREEFAALAALHPLMGNEFFDASLEWAASALVLQQQLQRVVKKRGSRLRADQVEQLHLYWKTFFAAGHLAVLAFVDGGAMLRARVGNDDAGFNIIAEALSAVVVDGGILTKTVRGSWALGQLGKAWLPHAKQRLVEAKSFGDVLCAALAMFAIGARYEDLRAEVIAAFDLPPALDAQVARRSATYICGQGAKLLTDIDTVLARHRGKGAALAMMFRDQFPQTSPYHYGREADVPDDIAFSNPFQVVLDFVHDPRTLPQAIAMVIPAARATAEQLYLPRRYVEFIERKWQPDHALLLMEGGLEDSRDPVPRPTGPKRKGPCPCGSGKKYKRCCPEVDARWRSSGHPCAT